MMNVSDSGLVRALWGLGLGWLCCAALACSSGSDEPVGTTAGGSATATTAGVAAPPAVAGTPGSAGSKAGSGAVAVAGAGAGTNAAGATASGAAGKAGAAAATGGTAASAGTPTSVQAGASAAGAAGGAEAGATAAAGSGGTSAAAGSAASAGSSASPGTSACKPWPTANGEESVSATIKVSDSYDGKLKRFTGSGALGGSGQDEGQDPLFELADGATLKNVVIGAPAADGVHCQGTCTLQNVWWEDVGEDAATFKGTAASQTMTVECAGARKADDKVLQHNGPGKMIVRHFYVDTFGKLYRSCGNCKSQFKREIELSDIDAKSGKSTLVGINENYGDVARLERIVIHDPSMKLDICERFMGNDSGDEPTKSGSGPDGKHCVYEESDISWQP